MPHVCDFSIFVEMIDYQCFGFPAFETGTICLLLKIIIYSEQKLKNSQENRMNKHIHPCRLYLPLWERVFSKDEVAEFPPLLKNFRYKPVFFMFYHFEF